MNSASVIGQRLIETALICWLVTGGASAMELRPGDLLVLTDAQTVTRYDPMSGQEEVVLSDPTLRPVHDVAVLSTSEIALLRCCFAGSLIAIVNLDTGEREFIELDFYVQNTLKVTPDGDLLVYGSIEVPGPLDDLGFFGFRDALMRVDRSTGKAESISTGGALGPLGDTVFDSCGDVIAGVGGSPGWGYVRVSSRTGRQTVIPLEFWANPQRGGMDVLPDGDILIVSDFFDRELPDPIVRVDPRDGGMSIVTVLTDDLRFHELATGVGEHFFVTSIRRTALFSQPTVLRVDLETGAQTIVAEPSREPHAIAVVPGDPIPERRRLGQCRSTRFRGFLDYLRSFPLRPVF